MDRKEYLKALLRFKESLRKNVNLSKMILFGSRARGDFREDSDFDLVIVSDDFKGIKSFKRASGFYLSWDIDSPVDFVCLTNEELEREKDEIGFIREVLKEGIEI